MLTSVSFELCERRFHSDQSGKLIIISCENVPGKEKGCIMIEQ